MNSPAAWALGAALVVTALLGAWWTAVADRYARLLANALRQWESGADDFTSDPFDASLLRRALFDRRFFFGVSSWLSAAGGLLLTVLAYGLHRQWGLSMIWIAVMGACGLLIMLAIVDARTSMLPDMLTMPLLWSGLAVALAGGPVPLPAAVAGAMAGYGLLFTLCWAFRLVRGKEGMGRGDLKLLAALGAWVGIQALPVLLLAACGGGLLFAVAVKPMRSLGHSYPFGPWLAASGMSVLLLGPELNLSF